MRILVFAVVLALTSPARTLSQTIGGASDHARPITISRAVRAQGSIRINAKLDESDWASAPATDSLTQIDPDEGKPASQPTEIRVLYDDDFLYVGVHLRDSK